MAHYKIVYEDPETLEEKTHEDEYDSIMWARDHGYDLADKGYYKILILKNSEKRGDYWELCGDCYDKFYDNFDDYADKDDLK